MAFNWLSMITGVFYVVLGIVVIVFKFFVIQLDPGVAYSLGALLVVYGLFRVGRAIHRIRMSNHEKNS